MFEIDPIFLHIVILSLAAMVSAILARLVKQPSALTHIITGIIIGPFVLALITDKELIQSLGEFGIILLLFFIGLVVKQRSSAELNAVHTLLDDLDPIRIKQLKSGMSIQDIDRYLFLHKI